MPGCAALIASSNCAGWWSQRRFAARGGDGHFCRPHSIVPAATIARRVWLDVKTGNLRARSLYASAGFIVASALATVVPEPDAVASDLLVMEHEVPLK